MGGGEGGGGGRGGEIFFKVEKSASCGDTGMS